MKLFKWIDLLYNCGKFGQGSHRKRIVFVFIFVSVLLSLVVGRLIQYQISYGKIYYKLHPSPPEKDSGFEVYVPRGLEDCFVELKKMLPKKLIKKIKDGKESNMIEYHMNLGVWIRNNWGLWKGSQLKSYFEGIGIHHPDDMSGVILDSFYRHLNNESIGLSGQVKVYQKYWEVLPKIFEKRKKEKVFKGDETEYKEIEVDVNDLVKDLSSEMNTD